MFVKPLAAALLLAIATAVPAESERAQHFQGLPAETLDQAFSNLNDYNGKLQAILDKDTLDGQDLAAIHELTYTLENAIEKIGTELKALAETLEAVHLASERGETTEVKTKGLEYLSVAREFAK